MKRSLLAILFWLAIPVEAQTPPASIPAEWQATSKAFWHVSIDYPVAASGGLSLIIGKERTTGVRGDSQVRGMIVNAEAGLGGFNGRLGYASLFQYAAGVNGFSIEAVYLRPWLLRSGLHSGENYVGPGVTYRFGYLRLSGAAVVGENGMTRQVRPSVTFGLVESPEELPKCSGKFSVWTHPTLIVENSRWASRYADHRYSEATHRLLRSLTTS